MSLSSVILIPQSREKNLESNSDALLLQIVQRCFASLNMTAVLQYDL
jgi:hypothetical protein